MWQYLFGYVCVIVCQVGFGGVVGFFDYVIWMCDVDICDVFGIGVYFVFGGMYGVGFFVGGGVGWFGLFMYDVVCGFVVV